MLSQSPSAVEPPIASENKGCSAKGHPARMCAAAVCPLRLEANASATGRKTGQCRTSRHADHGHARPHPSEGRAEGRVNLERQSDLSRSSDQPNRHWSEPPALRLGSFHRAGIEPQQRIRRTKSDGSGEHGNDADSAPSADHPGEGQSNQCQSCHYPESAVQTTSIHLHVSLYESHRNSAYGLLDAPCGDASVTVVTERRPGAAPWRDRECRCARDPRPPGRRLQSA